MGCTKNLISILQLCFIRRLYCAAAAPNDDVWYKKRCFRTHSRWCLFHSTPRCSVIYVGVERERLGRLRRMIRQKVLLKTEVPIATYCIIVTAKTRSSNNTYTYYYNYYIICTYILKEIDFVFSYHLKCISENTKK